jgi:hypothetical protein
LDWFGLSTKQHPTLKKGLILRLDREKLDEGLSFLHTEGVNVSVLQPLGIRTLNQSARNLILLVVDGQKKGHRVIIPPGESLVVGRTSASHVACEDDYMSSKHFEICNRSSDYFVKDLNSRNGTKVFDDPITSEKTLSQPCRITAGKSIFEVAWESSNEDWGTQAGSSISIRRSSLNFPSPIATHKQAYGDSAYGSSPSSHPYAESRGGPTNLSMHIALEERASAMCLELFHVSGGQARDSLPAHFERLYNWTRPTVPGESFLSDFYLSSLDFFAIASFSKLGVQNPSDIAWYPLYPSVDPAGTLAPIAIPKRAWLENCHIRWFDRLCSVDGICFLLTDSTSSPDWLLAQLNRGFKDLLTQSNRDDPIATGVGSSEGPAAIVPWYNPLELLATIGLRRDDSLAAWIPSASQGVVFPVRVSRLSFAFVRPKVAGVLREYGFHSASDRSE